MQAKKKHYGSSVEGENSKLDNSSGINSLNTTPTPA